MRRNITPDQVKILTALQEDKNVMVCSCHDSGKCLHKENAVYLANGQKVKAKDLVGKQFKILTPGLGGLRPALATAEWNKLEEIFELTTESGRKIKANKKHPLWSAIKTKLEKKNTLLYPKGWTQLKDLRTGDYVAVTQEFGSFGTHKIENTEVKLLSHLLINSYKENNRIYFIKKSEEQFKEITELLEQINVKLIETNKPKHYYFSPSNHISILYEKYKISDSLKHRKFDESIHSLGYESNKELIQSIFLNNTFIIGTENETKIKLYHRSEELLRDISYALLKFGISVKMHRKKSNDFWVLSVLSIKEFCKHFDCKEWIDKVNLSNGNIDSTWRTHSIPEGFRWEAITEIKYIGEDWTVAISVPETECYVGDFFEHNSWLAGAITCWNYDTNTQSITLTAGPNKETIQDGIWRELRGHREALPEDIRDLLPKESRMENGPDHFAAGFVAAKGASARGRKSPNMLMIFDEADGIEGFLWDSARGMLIAENAMWLCLLNPVDTSSRAKAEYDDGTFKNIHLSALNHPNVVAELLGSEKPFPMIGMNKQWVDSRITQGCYEIEKSSAKSNDIVWPPPTVQWHDELFEVKDFQPRYWRLKAFSEVAPRVLGRWPSSSENALWTDMMWEACEQHQAEDTDYPVEIGCDPSRGGADACSITVRRGKTLLHMEKHYGLDTIQVVERLKELCTFWGRDYAGMTAEDVLVKIDSTDTRAYYDLRGEFNFYPVIFNATAQEPKKYPNIRSELWFQAKDKADTVVELGDGKMYPLLDISRILKPEYDEIRKALKMQLTSVRGFNRSGGKKEVEQKAVTKSRLGGKSPDDADSFNLAYYDITADADEYTHTKFSKGAARKLKKYYGKKRRS